MLFYIILLVAEIIAFALLFVFIHCEYKVIEQEKKDLKQEEDRILLKYTRCIAAYDDLVRILEDYIQDESPPRS